MTTLTFGAEDELAANRLIALALREDLGDVGDLTSRAMIDADAEATVAIVARTAGVLAGGRVAQEVFQTLDSQVRWTSLVEDGELLAAGAQIALLSGRLRSLLTGERTALNFLQHLSGIATLTRAFVERAANPHVVVLDTRKTLPGWRRLEKYAVRAGGGANHRMGLFDGCLIKDNHLADWMAQGANQTLASAIESARKELGEGVPIEIEVDTIEQLAEALEARPEIVLLDNMHPAQLSECVALRNRRAPSVKLEASGGVTLGTIAAIAGTGVDRISVGAITHSAPALDIAFDWASKAARPA